MDRRQRHVREVRSRGTGIWGRQRREGGGRGGIRRAGKALRPRGKVGNEGIGVVSAAYGIYLADDGVSCRRCNGGIRPLICLCFGVGVGVWGRNAHHLNGLWVGCDARYRVHGSLHQLYAYYELVACMHNVLNLILRREQASLKGKKQRAKR